MSCRHCGSTETLPVLDLGTSPPSNAYLSPEDLNRVEPWAPLRMFVCRRCWLAQTEDFLDPEALFTPDYAYFSSISQSWLRHSEAFASQAIGRFVLGSASSVCEVAANDGYLLQYFKTAGVPCWGVEPTAAAAQAARTKGVEIVERFFGAAVAQELVAERGPVDLAVAINVLAHVPDINDFLRGFAHLLKPDGRVSFEFPHLLRMVEGRQFDTLYHEHFSYLSLSALTRILETNGLRAVDAIELPTHGGSLRVLAGRAETGSTTPSSELTRILAVEEEAGMTTPAFYQSFQPVAEQIKRDLLRFLIDAKARGRRIVAYGAAAKGNTLLNFSGVRPDLIEYVVDRAPSKQGRFMPGSRIPIVPEDRLRADRPDYVLVLPWNLRDEIASQLEYATDAGARLVVAIPEIIVF